MTRVDEGMDEGVDECQDTILPCPCASRRLHKDALNIHIDSECNWTYNHSPIKRDAMVRFFSSMLQVDVKGRHWIVTPTEMGRIHVADAPFMIVDMVVTGTGEDQIICFSTNIEDVVCIAADTPLTMKPSPVTGKMTPYVTLGEGLEAKISRAVYYELMELCVARVTNGITEYGLWSSSDFFPLCDGDALLAPEDLNA